ncbi:hypothetical protein [Cohnella fermenti]|uniref:Uncharacterized protein n=1 Tax=Cohnella fermenti TaxID=2565925 RepID=A0A4S4CA63_9BACL|nr:hypothetical protein [Cohnella fermenti]THF82720.1 hypothetical protein E6C55_06570 [Cohnella fermenti]
MDKSSTVDQFVLSSIKHGEATNKGDHKEANKSYKKIHKSAVNLLKEIETFTLLLRHENPYVRLWSGSYLVRVDNAKDEAVTVLNNLTSEPGLLGFNAKMVLQESVNK